MLDGTIIRRQMEKYIPFKVEGPDDVVRKLDVPYYYTNKPVSGESNGKATPEVIRDYVLGTPSNWDSGGGMLKPASDLQKYMNSHPKLVGVDCSGFAYYVLNEASDGAVRAFFETKIPAQLTYEYGLSAEYLTNKSKGYGTEKTMARDVVPGCTIRFKPSSGSTVEHVLVVYNILYYNRQHKIQYAHSSGGYGPHWGEIKIGNMDANLDDPSQTWIDAAFSDSEAKKRYSYTVLLDCLK